MDSRIQDYLVSIFNICFTTYVHHSFLSEKLHYLLCSFCSFCQDCSFGLKLMCPLQGKLVYVSAFHLKDLFYIFIHARLSQLILAHVLYLLFCKFVKLYDWMLQVSEGTDDAATSYLVHLLSDLNTLLKKVSSDVRHQGDYLSIHQAIILQDRACWFGENLMLFFDLNLPPDINLKTLYRQRAR